MSLSLVTLPADQITRFIGEGFISPPAPRKVLSTLWPPPGPFCHMSAEHIPLYGRPDYKKKTKFGLNKKALWPVNKQRLQCIQWSRSKRKDKWVCLWVLSSIHGVAYWGRKCWPGFPSTDISERTALCKLNLHFATVEFVCTSAKWHKSCRACLSLFFSPVFRGHNRNYMQSKTS